MRYLYGLIFLATLALGGCSVVPNITRTEEDVYTITERDTTVNQQVQNAPGDRDNGVIYPSSRTTETNHTIVQRDSIITREYPNFIRMGLFESVGMIGTARAERERVPVGTFGLFYDLKTLLNLAYLFDDARRNEQPEVPLFSGAMYRFGIAEWRLRWFRDAENWSVGTHAYEILIPSNQPEEALHSTLPIYLRKRYYLRDKIPYIALTPSVGLGFLGSQYINMSGSLDIGSIGGLNLRTYLGYAIGQNAANTAFVKGTEYEKEGRTSDFAYFGLGVSVLDFLNRPEETEREWKDHEHSSWNIGLLQFSLVASGADTSAFQEERKPGSAQPLISGFIGRFAPASVALPFYNNRFYAGTSLLNVVFLGRSAWGIGILPVRFGYWQPLIEDELTTEPFVEYNYYPSSFFHLGNRVNLRITDQINLNVSVGYASGSTVDDDILGSDFTENFGNPTSFSSAYFGIGISLSDRIFLPEELRYNR
jgi:hypothetical protein